MSLRTAWISALAGYGLLALILALWLGSELVWKIRDRRRKGRHRK